MSYFKKIRQSSSYRFIIWFSLFGCFFILIRLNTIITNPNYVPADDFVRYWAAGRIWLQGGNPYDPAQVQVVQDIVTGQQASALVLTPVYVPPWSLPLFALFGIIDYPTSRLFFLLFNIACFFLSAEFTWKLYNGDIHHKYWSWIICFSLGATISTLEKGQVSAIILLGLTSFIYYIETKKDWVAGISIILVTWKPQLLYLLWLAVLFWMIRYRKVIPIIWAFGLTTVCTVLSLIPNVKIISQYLEAIFHLTPFMFATPSIGAHLRYFLFGIEKTWPNYFPLALGFTWVGIYWCRKQKKWVWKDEISLLVFISVITALYVWTYDMALLVLPSIQAIIWALEVRSNRKKSILIGIFFLINLLNLLLHRYMDDFWFIWYAPALLIWYQVVHKFFKQQMIEREQLA